MRRSLAAARARLAADEGGFTLLELLIGAAIVSGAC
jgi:prepilin-type N-terminal cleavage/methylation domain-containing protein